MDHTCKIETTKSRGQHNVGQRDLEQRESFLFAALKLSAQELNVSEDAGTTSSAAVQCPVELNCDLDTLCICLTVEI